MIIGRVTKQPGELVPLSWDFTAELESGETITTIAMAATNARTGVAAGGILSGSPVNNSPVVTHKVTGGTVGDIVIVQCRATTNAGLTYEHEVELHVLED